MMKYLLLLPGLLSFNLYAETPEQDIDKICLRHAVSLVNKLKSEGITDNNATQSNKVLRLTTENCKEHFHTVSSKINDKNTNDTLSSADETEEKGDWFTEEILNSDTSRKKGNKRLDRMRHK